MEIDATRIRDIYAAEVHDMPVTRANQVPPSYEAITAEWLTDVLCSGHPGAKVIDFAFDARDDGSSNRRRIWPTYNAAGEAANLPASVFCKAAESLENRIVLGVSGTAQAETDFYRLVQPRLRIPTPRARYAGFDPANFAYFIMMDDMAADVRFPDERFALDRQHAEQMVETLARLHAQFFCSPELGTATLPFKTWPVWWAGMMKGAPDFGRFCDKGFERIAPRLPERLAGRRAEVWQATEASVLRHRTLPHTLIHSDVHLKNWFVLGDGQMGLHDWQLTTIGHWSRDFAFSLTTALTIDQRRDWFEDLLRLYLDRMAAHGAGSIDFDEAFRNVREQLMTAFAFWTITMCPTGDMPAMQPEHTTTEFLMRMGTAIDDYDSIDALIRPGVVA
ncbi:MAG: aminoglycoside phosphotransferase family protein [Blastomonas sp.]